MNSWESNDFNGSQKSDVGKKSKKKTDVIQENYNNFIKYVEQNTQEELNSARNWMFKENKKSAQNKSRVSQTARSNTTRKEMSNMYKLTVNNEPVSERKMSVTSSTKINQDQVTENKSKLQSNQKGKLEPSIFKVASGVAEPPLPDEWCKSPRQVYKVDEYKVQKGEQEQYTERLKKSKVDYTFKYKHLNNKILNFDKVKELFKKKETLLSDNEVSDSDNISDRIASEKKSK